MQTLVTISKVAESLGLHPDTLRKWEAKGLLKPVKTLGGHRRYSQEDIAILKQKIEAELNTNILESEADNGDDLAVSYLKRQISNFNSDIKYNTEAVADFQARANEHQMRIEYFTNSRQDLAAALIKLQSK